MGKVTIVAFSIVFLGALGCGKKDENKSGDKGGDTAGDTGDNKSGDTAKKPPEGPIELTDTADIGAAVKDAAETRYKGLVMKVPKGAVAEDSGMGLSVKYGEVQFELRWEFEDEGAVAKGKKAAESDDLDKLVKFHVDTPEAILVESKSSLGGPNNHHFVAAVPVGDKTLVCKNKGYGQFTKAQAEALLKSCQSASIK